MAGPLNFGSGGGSAGAYTGGAGGGIVNISASGDLYFSQGYLLTMDLDYFFLNFCGQILANGANGPGSAGGGSGGSVFLHANAIDGNGSVSAVRYTHVIERFPQIHILQLIEWEILMRSTYFIFSFFYNSVVVVQFLAGMGFVFA